MDLNYCGAYYKYIHPPTRVQGIWGRRLCRSGLCVALSLTACSRILQQTTVRRSAMYSDLCEGETEGDRDSCRDRCGDRGAERGWAAAGRTVQHAIDGLVESRPHLGLRSASTPRRACNRASRGKDSNCRGFPWSWRQPTWRNPAVCNKYSRTSTTTLQQNRATVSTSWHDQLVD